MGLDLKDVTVSACLDWAGTNVEAVVAEAVQLSHHIRLAGWLAGWLAGTHYRFSNSKIKIAPHHSLTPSLLPQTSEDGIGTMASNTVDNHVSSLSSPYTEAPVMIAEKRNLYFSFLFFHSLRASHAGNSVTDRMHVYTLEYSHSYHTCSVPCHKGCRRTTTHA